MNDDTMIDVLVAALPTDGTAVSNKRLQGQLKWTKAAYERVREAAVEARRVKTAQGQGGSLRRVLQGSVKVDTPVIEEAHKEAASSMPPTRDSLALDPSMPQPTNAKEEFAVQLHMDFDAASANGRVDYDEALIDFALNVLSDSQFDEPMACSYVDFDSFNNELRLRIDGYDIHEDDDENRDVIDLFVVHGASPYATADDGRTVLRVPAFDGPPVNALFRAARRFVEESYRDLDREITDNEEARGVARSIRASKRLARITINLVTNAEVRQFDRTPEKVNGVEVHKRVLDLNVLRRLLRPEGNEVDFTEAHQCGIPCVALPDDNGVFRSYLAVVPGAFLAKLYDRYKQQLLEANVRSYLKAGNHSVNQGIIETIRKQPERFFAYNNGITATADELVVGPGTDGGLSLVRCRNLQIVNGGQTTASLFHATLKKIPLERVFVPMKINEVLDRVHADDIVQQISFSANRQNKVSFSDFGANQPFHVALHSLAKREVPPVPRKGAQPGAKWTYERMRGQYQTDLTLQRTPARIKKFMQEYPKAQVLTKPDVARYHMIWDQRPFSVCYGAEKNYQRFRSSIGKDFVPDARWFRHLVAKALLVDCCDEIVLSQKVPGFKVNIVAYTVALLSCERGDRTDLDAIWRTQSVDDETRRWFAEAIPLVREHITAPALDGKNVGEVSKREDCWTRLLLTWKARGR
jgi:hypothetical protein